MITGKPLPGIPNSGEPLTLGVVLCVMAALSFGVVTAMAGAVIAAMVLLGLAGAGFTLANYRVGLGLLVLVLPISATTIFPREIMGITGANPLNALFALTLLSFMAERLWKQKLGEHLTYPRFWWAYVTPVVLAALIGVLHFPEIPYFVFAKGIVSFASPVGYLRDILMKPMLYILLAVMLGAACRDGMKITTVIIALCLSIWILAAWVFSFVLQSGFGLAQLAASTNRELLGGIGMHANELGALAACMLTLMLFAISHKDNTAALRCLYVMTAGISAALLIISFSRGAFLGFAVGLVAFFILQRRLKIVLSGLFLLALLLPLLPAELYDRLSTGLGTGGSQVLYSRDDPLTAGRVAGVWLPLLAEVREHPLFGNGLSSVAWSAALRSGALGLATLNPHNLYLKILLDLGVVGLTAVLLFYTDMWRRLRAAARNPATPVQASWLFSGAAVALLGYGVYGLSGGDFMPDPSNSLLWLAWGLMLAVPVAQVHTRPVRGGH